MKINIFFKPMPSGGGGLNFIANISSFFSKINVLDENPKTADVILFNSHHFFFPLLNFYLMNPNKFYVHRVDGPMSLYNHHSDFRDKIVRLANFYIADFTIFQSTWSQEKNIDLGVSNKKNSAIIYNAPNDKHFNCTHLPSKPSNNKIRLISTCWSTNSNKGFDTYKWLDKNLDFSRFEFIFIGFSPYNFDNIKSLGPMKNERLSYELKKSDIFIFPSRVEACSNALLEALHCGLPVVAFSGSSNSELVRSQGFLYSNIADIPDLIEKILKSKRKLKNNSLKKIDQIGYEYVDTIHNAFKNRKRLRFKKNIFFKYIFILTIYLHLYFLNLVLIKIKKIKNFV